MALGALAGAGAAFMLTLSGCSGDCLGPAVLTIGIGGTVGGIVGGMIGGAIPKRPRAGAQGP